MKIAQVKAKIISHRRLQDYCWHLEFESALIAKQAMPGQFVNIRIADSNEPLLRRPISIHGVVASKVKIMYEVVGQGTQMLSTRKPGEFLDVIGPLGTGFDYSGQVKTKSASNILVAGGMGVAPLVFLAEKLKLSKPLVLIGAKTKNQILCQQEFKALGCKVKLATDDGSVGFKGKVTDLLKNILLSTIDYRSSTLYACGPHPMLKALAQFACENKIKTQFSLEGHMACGTGACLGCVVATKAGYKTVCKDGPVFPAEELIW